MSCAARRPQYVHCDTQSQAAPSLIQGGISLHTAIIPSSFQDEVPLFAAGMHAAARGGGHSAMHVFECIAITVDADAKHASAVRDAEAATLLALRSEAWATIRRHLMVSS